MSTVIVPPKSTDGIVPISFAVAPDSKAPISLEELINIPFTADTLPRISSGVRICNMVVLIITLTLSKAPSKNKQSNEI